MRTGGIRAWSAAAAAAYMLVSSYLLYRQIQRLDTQSAAMEKDLETSFVRRALGLGADRFKPVSVVTDLHSVETRFVVHTACCQMLKLQPLRFDRVLELFARADAKFNPKVVRVRL